MLILLRLCFPYLTRDSDDPIPKQILAVLHETYFTESRLYLWLQKGKKPIFLHNRIPHSILQMASLYKQYTGVSIKFEVGSWFE